MPETVEAPIREISGSARAASPGAVYAGPQDPQEQIELTLVLRRRRDLPADAVLGSVLTSQELGERYGAAPADIEQVQQLISAAGGEVVRVDPGSRRVRVTGAARVWTALFGTELTMVRSPDPTTGALLEHRHRTGSLHAPAALAELVVAVLGLDDRPQARAHFQLMAAAATTTSYTPLQLAHAYAMPAGTDGSGQTIAIIELGGGFGQSDLDTYFGGLKLATPRVTAASVDNAQNQPGGDPSGADGEVLLDIEVAGAIAPKADIVVYFAPNTDAGFLDAIAEAAHATPTPTAISISWGQSEDSWTAQARTAMDQAFADAAALGITVTVAAGDNGSSDDGSSDDGSSAGGPGAARAAAHVDFPAASPHVLACGGTSLELTGAGRRQPRGRLERRDERRRHRRWRQRHLRAAVVAGPRRRARAGREHEDRTRGARRGR